MSFILDAIAKSERERQQQEIPDARILAMPLPETRQAVHRLPYFIITLLLMLIIGLLIWMQFFNFSRQNPPLPAIVKNDTLQTNPVEPSVTLKSVNTIARTVAVPTMEIDPTDKTRMSGIEKPAINDQANDKLQASVDTHTKSVSTATTDQVAKQQTIQPLPAETDATENFSETEFAEKNQQTEAVVTAEREITPLNELPLDVRRDLPVVTFTGHLYSKNPRLSNVMVNGGRSVIAGQRIVDDLYLYKVTPSGVIVDFRGYLIETGVLQNWSLK